MPTRRDFLHLTAAAGGLLGARRLAGASLRAEVRPASAPAPLDILILGGTAFLGPAQVEYALARGHRVTLFNRGRTNPHLFPEVEKLIGDRNDDLTALEDRRWDAVIDNSASVPRWVRQTAELLNGSVNRYLYVSSLSAFADMSILNQDESGPLAQLDDPTVEQVTGATYGGMKALSEHQAQNTFGERAIIVRPGLIVGPMDRTDRFTYWPVRIDRGGEVLAPGAFTDGTQIVDVRDLGQWMVRMVENEESGVYNATGPEARMTMPEMLYGCRAVTSAAVSFTWADADFLEEHEVRPWSDMPCWIPPRDGMEGFSTFNCDRAMAKGLTFRPLAETALDTLDWFKTLPAERQAKLGSGLAPEREAEVLAAWHAQHR